MSLVATSVIDRASAATGINHQINFQGKLVNPNGTNVTDGSYSIVFSIYTVASAGSNIWTETQSVTVTNGIFQVNLGSVTALPGSVDFNTDNIYLGIKVGADAEMTPRVQFTSVPQAFNSEKLGGLDKTGFIQNQTGVTQTADFKISGTGNIGTSLTTPVLQSAAAAALTITGNAASTWSTSAGNITLQAGSGTISLGSTTTLSSTGALTITGGGALSLGSTGANALTLDSGTTGAINIGNNANAKTITIGNVSGATQIVLNTGTGGVVVNNIAGSQMKVTSNAVVPTIDQVAIDNTGSSGVVANGVNGLSINYKGGAAAVEAAAQRIDLQPGATSGGTWTGVRVVQNATGPATGVTANGAKLEGPTTGGAGTYNAINVANIGAVASGGITRGINITGTNSQAAGTVRGIQLNNLTAGAASEIGIDLGTGWDNLLTYNNGATVIVNGSGQLNLGSVTGTLVATNGGTGQSTYAVGDLLIGDTSNTLSKIAAVASGSCLISQGVTTKPIWGACGAAGITGVTTIDTAANTGNGIAISGSNVYLQSASASFGGILNTTTQTIAGAKTFNTALTVSATGGNAFAVSGAPTNSATSSLIQFGAAIAGGNTTASGGTYLGMNIPNAGAGSAADFLNFQKNGVSKLKVDNTGMLSAAGGLVVGDLSTGANGFIELTQGSGSNTIHIQSAGAGASVVMYIPPVNGATFCVDSGNCDGSAGGAGYIKNGTSSQTASFNIAGTGKITGNSATAFQVQNASGAPIFLVDTTTTSNFVTNPGFEVNTSTGWTYTSATGTQNLTKTSTYHGSASNSVNITVANGSANVTSFTAAITPATYTFSFYAMKGTNNGTLSVAVTGGSAPACALVGYTAPVTTGFQRYYCTFTSTTTNVTAISIKSNNTGTFYLDAVELNTGAFVAPYAAQGAVQLRGTINNPLVLQNTADSTSAFQIQNSAGTSNLLVADTLNGAVSIGGTLTVSNSSATALQVTNGTTSALTVDTTVGTTILRGTTTASDAAVIGSELFVTDSFGAAGGWGTISGTGSSATATHASGGGTTAITTTNAAVNGNTYQIQFTISGNSSDLSTVKASFGGVNSGLYGTNGTQTVVLTAISTAALSFTPTNSFDGTVTGISIKQITFSAAFLSVQSSASLTRLEVRANASNTFMGLKSGQSTSSGTSNTGYGARALSSNTTGSQNTATGNGALQNNTVGSSNAAFGASALLANNIGSSNAAFGASALTANTSGGSNTAIGIQALSGNTTGSNNVAIGGSALQSNINGSGVTAIGYSAGALDINTFTTSNSLQNATVIGAYAQVQGSNNLILGSIGTSGTTNVGIGTTQAMNILSVEAIDYSTGTVSQTGTAITGIGTTFTSAMVGDQITFATNTGYTAETITAFVDATHLTASVSQSVSNTNFRLHKPGLQVTSSGNVGIGTLTPSTALHVSSSATDQATFTGTGTRAEVIINATNTGNQSALKFQDAGTTKYILGRDTDNTFFQYDAAFSRNFLNETTAGNLVLQPSGGNVGIGVNVPAASLDILGTTSVATAGSNIVTSQNFTSANWTTCNGGAGGWTGTTTTATHNTGNTVACSAAAGNFTVVSGATYQVTYTLAGNTTDTNTVTASMGGFSAPAIGQTGTNTQSFTVTAGSTASLTFTPTTNFNGVISNVSVKLVTLANSVLTVRNSDTTAGLEVRAGGSNRSNTFVGLMSGQNSDVTSGNNTGFGAYSLQSNVDGYSNTGVGRDSLKYNVSGYENTALGDGALRVNTNGTDNTALGYGVLTLNTTGTQNVGNGAYALSFATTASWNTGLGYQSLYTTTGNSNTGVGYRSGYSNTTGTFNTFLGLYADASVGNLINATAIGANSYVTANNSIVIGSINGTNGASANTNVGIGTTAPTATLQVKTAGTNGTAFQIQDTSNASLLNADTSNMRVSIGSIGTSTAQLYVSGSLPTATLGSLATATSPRDIVVSGRYAYISFASSPYGIGIFDLSNPASPVLIGSINVGSSSSGVAVSGNYVYVSNFLGASVSIFDVTNPAAPVSVGSAALPGGSGPTDVAVSGRYLFVTNNSLNTLAIFDVSNPTAPLLLSLTATNTGPNGVTIQGKYAYVLDKTANNLQIFDISNPAIPVLMTAAGSYAGANNAIAVRVVGRYAYIVNTGANTLNIADISNPTTVTSVGNAAIGANSHSVVISGHYAYVTSVNGNTINVIDISNPASPTAVGTIPSSGGTYGLAVVGRYAYATGSTGNTLQTFDLGGSYIQQLETGSIEAAAVSVTGGLNVQGAITSQSSAAVGTNLSVGRDLSVYGNTNLGGATSTTTAATPAFVKQTATSTSTSRLTQTMAVTSTTGNLLVATVGTNSTTTPRVNTIIDSAGNTWQLGTRGYSNGPSGRIEIWYAANAQAVTSVSVNFDAASPYTLNVSEYSGVAATNPLDEAAGNSDGVTSTTVTTPGITTAANNELVIAAIGRGNGATTTATPAGFTNLNSALTITPNTYQNSAYQVKATAGAVNASWTLSSTSLSGAAIVAFKPASSVTQISRTNITGNVGINIANSDNNAALTVAGNSSNLNNAVAIIQGATGQVGNILQVQDANANQSLVVTGTGVVVAGVTKQTQLNIEGFESGSLSNYTNVGVGAIDAVQKHSGANAFHISAAASAASLQKFVPTTDSVDVTTYAYSATSATSGNPNIIEIGNDSNHTVVLSRTDANAGFSLWDRATSTTLATTATTFPLSQWNKIELRVSIRGNVLTATAWLNNVQILTATENYSYSPYFYYFQLGDTGSVTTNMWWDDVTYALSPTANAAFQVNGNAMFQAQYGQVGNLMDFLDSGGNSKGFIDQYGNATFTDFSAGDATFTSYGTGLQVLTAKGTSGQTADILNVRDSSNNTLLAVNGGGKVAIGVTTALYQLDVRANINGYTAQIKNTNAGTATSGLLVDLPTTATSGRYLGFAHGGTVGGNVSVVNGTTVAYNTTGADYAEYFKANAADMPQAGELVAIDPANEGGVIKATSISGTAVGVVSTAPGFVGNGPACPVDNVDVCEADYAKNNTIVAISGQVPVKVSVAGGAIHIGDAIGFSATAGIGQRATSGAIVGYAESATEVDGTVQVLIRPGVLGFNPNENLQARGITSDTLQTTGNAQIGGSMSVAGDVNVGGLATIGSLNITGSAVFGADVTVKGSVTIEGSLTVAGPTSVQDITINGHIITAGTAPTTQLLPAAGSANTTVAIDGNDTSGTVTITVGDATSAGDPAHNIPAVTGPSLGDLLQLNFAKHYTKAPRIMITGNDAASAAMLVHPSANAADSFKLSVGVTPTAHTTYSFTYYIVE